MRRDGRKHAASKQEVQTVLAQGRPHRQGWQSGFMAAENMELNPNQFKRLREQSATVIPARNHQGQCREGTPDLLMIRKNRVQSGVISGSSVIKEFRTNN